MAAPKRTTREVTRSTRPSTRCREGFSPRTCCLTTAGRQKARNLARDPRVSLTVFDAENPYQSVDIRGTAELIEDRDKSLLRPLWQKYVGQGPPGEAGTCSG